ncbi:hypothetical protein F2Q68_00013652 [Brassica cretica]|nr:hypothetical protein F2Q68_00013652 [Brassica cretica]
MKELEAEIEAYRLRYGLLREEEDGQGREPEEFLDETKPVLDLPVCSSNGEEDLEHKQDSAEEPKANNDGIIEEEREDGSRKAVLVKEITEITERLSAIESKGELLQQISEVLDVSEGEAILYQISQNLHMLRSFIEMPSES